MHEANIKLSFKLLVTEFVLKVIVVRFSARYATVSGESD